MVAALFAVSSDSSGDSGQADEYVDAIMKDFESSSSTPGLSRAEARCVAEDIVDTIGVERFQKAGITPKSLRASDGDAMEGLGKDLTRPEAERLVDVVFRGDCFDIGAVFAREAREEQGTSAKTARAMACFFRKMTELPAFRKAMADSLQGKSSTDDALDKALGGESKLFAIMGECGMSPSDFANG
jgi:hypothetical protein